MKQLNACKKYNLVQVKATIIHQPTTNYNYNYIKQLKYKATHSNSVIVVLPYYISYTYSM